MKIIEEKFRSAPLSDDYIYKMDSLKDANEIRSLCSWILTGSYQIDNIVINFVKDHSDFRSTLNCDSQEQLLAVLANNDMREIENIDLILNYKGQIVYGTIYPDSGVFRLSFQKKNNILASKSY